MKVASHFAALIFAITPVSASGMILSGYETLDPTIIISPSVTASLDTIGVTEGSKSLKVTSAGEWNEPVFHDTGALLNTIKSVYDTYGSAVLKLDFTAPAAAPAGWFRPNSLFKATVSDRSPVRSFGIRALPPLRLRPCLGISPPSSQAAQFLHPPRGAR